MSSIWMLNINITKSSANRGINITILKVLVKKVWSIDLTLLLHAGGTIMKRSMDSPPMDKLEKKKIF